MPDLGLGLGFMLGLGLGLGSGSRSGSGSGSGSVVGSVVSVRVRVRVRVRAREPSLRRRRRVGPGDSCVQQETEGGTWSGWGSGYGSGLGSGPRLRLRLRLGLRLRALWVIGRAMEPWAHRSTDEELLPKRKVASGPEAQVPARACTGKPDDGAAAGRRGRQPGRTVARCRDARR